MFEKKVDDKRGIGITLILRSDNRAEDVSEMLKGGQKLTKLGFLERIGGELPEELSKEDVKLWRESMDEMNEAGKIPVRSDWKRRGWLGKIVGFFIDIETKPLLDGDYPYVVRLYHFQPERKD
ncbi:hypothetical protein ILYODFUR_030800 [Ilyodon furcidens]|uniref:Uncharacterized protein n=1 Tax=Ilyodon furcidens TaxID=33524 RepID=A0ABV0TN60_9TELE